MFSKAVFAVLASYVAIPAVYAAAAAPIDIALVKQQFVNALITPAVVPIFDPTALLNASFPATGAITTGQAVSKDDAGAQPTITIVGTDADFASGGSLSATAKYTIIMIDGDYAGATNANGVNTHYLQNDLTLGTPTDDDATLTAAGDAVIAYAGPGPAANSGAHRYILLLFAQPDNFAAPSTPAAGSSVTMIDFPAYIKAAGFTAPIAGNYFTVEVGTSTVSASATTAVNTATLLSQAGSSSASGSASKTASGSTTASASTTAKPNAAFKNGVSAFGAGAIAMVFGAILV